MIIYLLVFLSGFCALIYQVLWMKELGLRFGNTSHAAGATLRYRTNSAKVYGLGKQGK